MTVWHPSKVALQGINQPYASSVEVLSILSLLHHQTIATLGSLLLPLLLLFLQPQFLFLGTKVIFPSHACASAFLSLQKWDPILACTACTPLYY